MRNSYMLVATIALSLGCAMAQEPLRGVADPAPHQILIASASASSRTSGHAAPILIGSDGASGRDSAELPAIYGIIRPGIVRIQAGGWRMLEPTNGIYDWSRFDASLFENIVVNISTQASNFAYLSNAPQPQIMFCVYGPPSFYTNSQAAFIGGETNFVKALLRHAPHRIQIIEFINEPGGGYNWIPQCTNWQDIAAFTAKLANAVSTTARAVDSTVKI